MKIRFIIDSTNYGSWSKSASSNTLLATNVSINSSHTHESYCFHDMLRSLYGRGVTDTHYAQRTSCIIDLPDEISFQFMLQGVQDYDFLAYNLYSKKLCFAADPVKAIEYMYSELGYGSVFGGSGVNPRTCVLAWPDLEHSVVYRDPETHPVLDDFYGPVLDYITPNVQEWIITQYCEGANRLTSILNERKKTDSVYPMPPRDVEYIERAYMNTDTLLYLMEQYRDDGEFYLGAKRWISAHEWDVWRQIYLDVWYASTECTPTKVG